LLPFSEAVSVAGGSVPMMQFTAWSPLPQPSEVGVK
jgi:hypothetical protein